MNFAEKIKRQTDKILRQQSQGPNAGRVIIETPAGGNLNTIPGTDLATHKTSSDHDGRYYTEDEVDALLNFLGLSDTPESYEGQGSKIVAVKSTSDGLEFISAPPAANGIPTGGANNQLLAKDGTNDYMVKWVNAPSAANGIPAGGTVGQILAKVDEDDYDTQWIDAPSGGGGAIEYYYNPAYPATITSSRTEKGFGLYFTPFISGTITKFIAKTDWVNGTTYIGKIYDDTKNVIAQGSIVGDGTNGSWKEFPLAIPLDIQPLSNYYLSFEDSTGANIKKYYGDLLGDSLILKLQTFSGLPDSINSAADAYAIGFLVEF